MSHFKKAFYEKLAASGKEVSAIAVIHKGKMLMGMRTKEQRFTTPCGHIEGDETPAEGAVRELWEESGIRAKEEDLKFLKTIKKPDGYIIHGYRLDLKKFPRTTGKNDPDQEVKRWRFYDTKSIPDSKLHVPRDQGNVLLESLEKKANKHKKLVNLFGDYFDNIRTNNNVLTYARDKMEGEEKTAEKVKIMNGDHYQSILDAKRGDGVDRGKAVKVSKNGKSGFFTRGELEAKAKKHRDLIPGGLADKNSNKDFDKKSINKGSKVELEHTNSKPIAEEIARDHLKEDPKYYEKLEKMEKKAFLKGFKKALGVGAMAASIGAHAGDVGALTKNPAAKAAFREAKRNKEVFKKVISSGSSKASKEVGSATGNTMTANVTSKSLADHVSDMDKGLKSNYGLKIRPNKVTKEFKNGSASISHRGSASVNYKDLGVDLDKNRIAFHGNLNDNTRVNIDPKNKSVSLGYSKSF